MKAILKALGTTAILGLTLTAGSVTGGDEKRNEAKSEFAKLKGTWVKVLDGNTYLFTVNGDRFAEIFEFPEGTSTATGTITIDTTSKPKHMDWKFAAGTGRGEKLKGVTALTIYELEGDTFRFCASKNNVRPEVFPEKESIEGDYLYLVFKRAK